MSGLRNNYINWKYKKTETNLHPEEEVPKVVAAGRKLKAGIVQKVVSLEHYDVTVHQFI